MKPNWTKFLKQQQNEGRLGLTLSFLVGALRTPPGSLADAENSLAELRALLDSMRDESRPYGNVITVFECGNLRQPVAALSNQQQPGDPIEGRDKSSVNLFVWPWYQCARPVDFDWLVKALWEHFRVPISEGTFSYSRSTGKFGPFDENDLAFIKRALAPDEDA